MAVSLSRARALCALAYLVALGAAAAAVMLLPIASPWWRVVAADVLGTLVIFGFSYAFDNSSFYDAYWSVAPIAMTAYWSLGSGGMRPLLIVALVSAWGVRLTYNWLRGWQGLGHEDWRYRDLRAKTGRAYWLVSLLGIHLFPTVQVLLGSYAAYLAITSSHALGWLDGLAAAVTLSAIVIEATADRQLHDFVRTRRDRERILDGGLWRYSRHPNYFGEVLFWWGLALFALAAAPGAWLALVGPLAIAAMFLFVSIPMIDARMLARRPAYAERMRRVSRLVPWFVKS